MSLNFEKKDIYRLGDLHCLPHVWVKPMKWVSKGELWMALPCTRMTQLELLCPVFFEKKDVYRLGNLNCLPHVWAKPIKWVSKGEVWMALP